MFTALIVDDEIDGRSLIRKSLELFCPQFSKFREATDRAQALQQLVDREVDMIFLDINLKKENGIDIYPELLGWCPNIVFVTAFDEYAVKAFRVKALHYILKPIDPDDLIEAVNRADLTQGRIVISNLGKRTPLTFQEIIYLKSDGPYVHFHTIDGRTITGTHGLKYYDERLNSPIFCRPQQSYLVNLTQVNHISMDESSHGTVYLRGKEEPITMSKRMGPEFIKALGEM